MLAKDLTPSAIVRYLDQYVIGQDEAKQVMAVAVYAHYRKLALAKGDMFGITKSNVLLVGPTGTGKTLTCETLSRLLDVPFASASATSLAQSKYVNEEIEAIMQRLVETAGGDIGRAQYGIVFIDEIDKLKGGSDPHAASGESVQHALLRIMEGTPVKLPDGRHLDTSGILFMCGGAFVGLEKIMAKSHSFGYISSSGGSDQSILDRLNSRVKPTDLFEFGLIPEFTGRLPIVASFRNLNQAMLVRIMTEPRNSLVNQFRQLFANEGVDLHIESRVLEQVAEIAFEYKTGARSLRGIFEELMTPILYVVPDDRAIKAVRVNSLFEDPVYLRQP